ncbi:zinc ribbon domain-containing protein [Methanobrevibacter sp.]|uniref:zinc-ribbon domain-containing protein n=1 Tax=Methanobrevibacter sp. TaxID=66852 RepID=UPI0026DEFAA3|nr:zinc ribbon domain-containing protein [Methanobrevibacter sp.]MDO5860008.1 zinc ribbon domain-containing protein [Methanobrevibacter sp.]
MTRICSNCEYENKDEYDYCAKCGNPLVEGLKPKQIYVYNAQQPRINKKAVIISYIITIFLSWGGVIANLLAKNNFMTTFAFFGFFMPFYLIQAPVKELRIHGFIQLAISALGVGLSFYIMLH